LKTHEKACYCGFARKELSKVRLKAIRSGLWYKALRRIDRVLFDLALTVSAIIRSKVLSSSLAAIMGRLSDASANRIEFLVKRFGIKRAAELSMVARRFGNKSAWSWETDLCFARFLTVMAINNPSPIKM